METSSRLTKEVLSELATCRMLYLITGHRYSFAEASCRTWDNEDNMDRDSKEGFFQLMPDDLDDGFFDWYCSERPHNQFFRTAEDCALNFLYWWTEFKRLRKHSTSEKE